MATSYTVVGGSGGSPFRHDVGGVLTRLVVWTSFDCVTEMTFVYSDGSSCTIGCKVMWNNATELALSEGERIARLAMEKSPFMRVVLLTRIEITTSRGTRFAVGATYETSVECVVDVASGIIIGECLVFDAHWL